MSTEEKPGRLAQWMNRFDEKLDRIDSRLDRIDVTLGTQAKDIEHHIHRTDLAEQHLAELRTEMEPLKKHVLMFAGVGKAVAFAGAVVGLVAGLMHLFGLGG